MFTIKIAEVKGILLNQGYLLKKETHLFCEPIG